MFYIIIMFLSIGVWAFERKNTTKTFYNSSIYIISFLILLLPHAFRYGIGTDYFYTYVPYFRWIGTGQREFTEIGFNLINKVVYSFTEDYKVLFFVFSLLTFIPIYKSIFENSRHRVLSILMIFLSQYYFYSMNMVRQSIAMAIIFYGFKFLKNEKKVKYCVCCIIATLIHSSAVLMLPLGLLACKNLGKKQKIVISFVTLILSFFIGSNIYRLINKYTNYGWYYNSAFMEESLSITLVITNALVFVLTLLYEKKDSSKEFKILSNFNFIGILFLIISANMPLVYRIVRYFTMFQILLIPEIIMQEKNSKSRLLLSVVLIIIFFVVMYRQIIMLGGEGVYPYVSIFD